MAKTPKDTGSATTAVAPAADLADDATLKSFTKINEFKLQIQGRLLDNLGIKMYSKLGKVLVEFAANAYDSESSFVDIRFDAALIETARQQVRTAALTRMKAEAQTLDPEVRPRAFVVHDALPQNLMVTIIDHGHGMTPQEIAQRFLPLNKNRRVNASGKETKLRSEAGKRLVMGRKGIGKLSAFGAAETMTIRSKRIGQEFWTEVSLEASVLMNAADLAAVAIPHKYVDATEEEKGQQGTVVTLSGLRCDSMSFTTDDLKDTLNETFYPIRAEEFEIRLNGAALSKPDPELEFWFPVTLKKGELAEDTITDAEWGELSFNYRVQFRKKSLRADKRGA